VAQGSLPEISAPQLAGSPRNGATVAWKDAGYSLIARRIRGNGTLGPRRRFTTSLGPGDPAVAVGRSGTTVAVWSDGRQRIFARRMTPHGKLGRVHHLGRWSPAQSEVEFDIGLDSRGDATIVWSTLPRESSQGTYFGGIGVHARRLNVSGRLEPRIDLPLASGGNIHPRVAVTPIGRATLVWEFLDGPGPAGVHSATISRRGRLGRVTDVSGGSQGAWLGDLAMDARGNLTVVWQSFAPGADTNAIVARRIGAHGSLGPINVLGAGSRPSDVNYAPKVALDRAGNATVTWFHETVRPPDSFSSTIESRLIDFDGNLNPLTTVPAPFSDVTSFRIAVDPAGNQTLAWVRRPQPLQNGAYFFQRRRIGRDGVLGGIDTVASGACNTCFELSAQRLIADDNGVVTAVWLEPQPNLRAAIRLSRFVPH
jgi:hypothetical protein